MYSEALYRQRKRLNMESKLELNEKSMLKGVGAAGFTAAFTFIAVMLINILDINGIEIAFGGYILPAVNTVCVLFMLLSDGLRDYIVRLITFIVMTAAMLLVYVRVGLNFSRIIFPAVYFIAAAAAGAVIAGAVSVIISRKNSYRDFIEKKEPLHNRLSIFSIAAAFICIAAASMIYG